MEIVLSKLTPFFVPKKVGKHGYVGGYADFDISLDGQTKIAFKLKGIYVVQYQGKTLVKLVTIYKKTDKEKTGPRYSPFIWQGKKLMAEFCTKAAAEVDTKWPRARWKEGIYSKFKQGLQK